MASAAEGFVVLRRLRRSPVRRGDVRWGGMRWLALRADWLDPFRVRGPRGSYSRAAMARRAVTEAMPQHGEVHALIGWAQKRSVARPRDILFSVICRYIVPLYEGFPHRGPVAISR